MRSCNECGSEVAENDVFCPFCGLSLPAAEPMVSIPEAIPEPTVAEDELESTIMMTPEEALGLAGEAVEPAASVRSTVAEASEAAGNIAVAEEVKSDAERSDDVDQPVVTSVADDQIDTTIGQSASSIEVPPPAILSDAPNTSGNVHLRSTSEYESADAEIFAEGSDDPSEYEATMIGMPLEEASDADSVDTSSSASTPEDQYQHTEYDVTDEERKDDGLNLDVAPTEPEEKMISMPSVDLGMEDSFAARAMFDSVRIIEGQNPFAQDDIATRIGTYSDQSVNLADDTAQGKESEQKPQTTPNIGLTDTDGRKSTKLKPLSEGTILNSRYEIIRKIGGGGMGAVYLASDNNLGGVLRAVKEMVQAHIEEDQQEKAIADFKRESMILSTLDHPSIPTIFDYFYDEQECRFYLVMKYISGGDLASRLRAAPEGKIDEKTVVDWAIQITDVLDYLHNQPSTIVYRDLKPSNIMIDGNSGRVMLIDFGIARSISQKEEKGVTAVGTMGYAPPELFSGNVEPRSDIYSLGSTMFHLLTGADPQSNPLLIFDFQKNPRPRQINPRLSDQIELILMRSVEYNASARYSSAAELKKVLEQHLELLWSGRATYGAGDVPVSVSLANQQVFCGFCGQRIVATDLFCAFCGAKQPIAQQGVHSEIYSSSAPKTARLLIEGTSELSTPTYLLEKQENLVGRRDPMSNIFPEVDLSKYDPQTKISRRHARIWKTGSEFMVEDLGSSNGTVLTPVTKDPFRLPPHTPHTLANGDKIKIGDTVLHFIVN